MRPAAREDRDLGMKQRFVVQRSHINGEEIRFPDHAAEDQAVAGGAEIARRVSAIGGLGDEGLAWPAEPQGAARKIPGKE